MRYRLLGKTGVRISEVALGTMTFGEDWGWGAPPDVSARILDLFADAGGNVIDTADVYTNGTSETILGELLKGRRDRFVLGTKFTNQTDPGDPNSAGNHRKKIVTSIEASLRRLQTDHIDLYWVHARDVLTPVEELMRALDDQVRAGKILYPAVSDWAAWEIAEACTAARLRDWSPFTAVQLRYNLLDRSPERELLPMASALDLPVFTWGPLAEGRLTGKYLSGHTGRATEAGRAQPSHARVPRRRHAGSLRRRRGLRRPATRYRRPPRAGRAPHHHGHLVMEVSLLRRRPRSPQMRAMSTNRL